MTIEVLSRVIPPPLEPAGAFLGPWAPIEAELGTALPPDYKDLVGVYGSGYFMEFFGIGVPRSPNLNLRLETKVPQVCATFFDRDELAYPLWPDQGGLVPFGATDNGDFLFWLPRGAPEDWGVVVWDRGLWNFEAFDCDLTSFIAGLATGEIIPEAFPEDLATCDHLFQPHTPGDLRWPPLPKSKG
jgi:hypothetical protein